MVRLSARVRSYLRLFVLAIIVVGMPNRALALSERTIWNYGPITGTSGLEPVAGLISDANGNLYSTTAFGGAFHDGTVFELSPPAVKGGKWTESTLWNFGAYDGDGADPYDSLIMDASGNLYGTTSVTSTASGINAGTVFELIPPSTPGGTWSESLLWSFGKTDGENPDAGLIMDASGNLYGTTGGGGAFQLGTVFELSPPSTSGVSWTESTLWSFGNATDGIDAAGGLIMDKKGQLYGTTVAGGVYAGGNPIANGGTVFKLTPPSTSGGSWSESILWNFGNGTDGYQPYFERLIFGTNGVLYGTARQGGGFGGGTVFALMPPSTTGGSWNESILWNFYSNPTDGAGPSAGLLIDKFGNFYSTTEVGGTYGLGTAFKLTPPAVSGGSWSESILYNFGNDKGNGNQPFAGFMMDKAGNLYSTTQFGGTKGGNGTVFEISGAVTPPPPPTPWTRPVECCGQSRQIVNTASPSTTGGGRNSRIF